MATVAQPHLCCDDVMLTMAQCSSTMCLPTALLGVQIAVGILSYLLRLLYATEVLTDVQLIQQQQEATGCAIFLAATRPGIPTMSLRT